MQNYLKLQLFISTSPYSRFNFQKKKNRHTFKKSASFFDIKMIYILIVVQNRIIRLYLKKVITINVSFCYVKRATSKFAGCYTFRSKYITFVLIFFFFWILNIFIEFVLTFYTVFERN